MNARGDDGSVSAALERLIGAGVDRAGGFLPFSRFMAFALYAPGLGYYASGRPTFGRMPAGGSDFVTAPELSPLFGRALARQVGEALEASATAEVFEFGAGSGALAQTLLDELGGRIERYSIVEVSASLRARQQARLGAIDGAGGTFDVDALPSDASSTPMATPVPVATATATATAPTTARSSATARRAPVRWLDALPDSMRGVVVVNEVLDAMPVELLHFDGQQWLERGVGRRQPVDAARAADERDETTAAARADGVGVATTFIGDAVGGAPAPAFIGDEVGDAPAPAFIGNTAGDAPAPAFAWRDRPTSRRPPVDTPFPAGSTLELHDAAEGFVATIGERLERGVALIVDYGFPRAEYYHPQRSDGTLMCHRAHRADTDPMRDVGLKDITAHVDFTGIALAAESVGLDVLGYTSQGRFLLNCGIAEALAAASPRERADALKLVAEHEMGELFKVMALGKGVDLAPLGFASGDRRHRL